MAFQPFERFGALTKAVLPNASNSATVTVPSGAASQADAAAVSIPVAPVAPVSPTTPVVASGPTKPITGIVTTPAADIAQRGIHSTWQGGGAGLLVTGNPKLAALIALIAGLLALVRSWLSHRKQAKA